MDWIASLSISDDETEIDVHCTGEYFPATRGYRDSLGVPEEPDEPACVELETAMVYGFPGDKGRDITCDLTDEQIESLEEQGLSSVDEYGDGV
jgi:hypothetical protein